MTKVLLIINILSIWPPIAAASDYWTGEGTIENPYLIYTPAQLNQLRESPSDWGRNFKLMTEIDLSGQLISQAFIAPDLNAELPDFQGTPFRGTFDGNGKSIRGLTISSDSGGSYLGFFGFTDNAQVNNLTLENIAVISGGGSSCYIGGMIGYHLSGSITNCRVSGIVSGNYIVGGLAGYAAGSIIQCSTVGSFSGFQSLGGLVGKSAGSITNCYSKGTVTGVDNSSKIGGLIGSHVSGAVLQCYSNSSVYGGNFTSSLGGLVGDANSLISECFSVSHIMAGPNSLSIGGLAGSAENDIENCYSTGYVQSGNENTYVGGLAGRSEGAIRFCYSDARVTVGTGTSYAGGLIGYNSGTESKSYWDIQVSSQQSSDGGIGLNSAQMKQKGSFLDWDFLPENIDGDPAEWMNLRVDGVDYPKLVWQIIDGDITGSYGVDIADLEELVGCWLEDDNCFSEHPNTDVNGDGLTDLSDFSILAQNWLEGFYLVEQTPQTMDDYTSEQMVITTGAELIPDTTADTYNIINAGDTFNYLWGYSYSSKKVYKKSKTSGDWTYVPQAGFASSMWLNSEEWIIGFDGVTAGHYSVDEGQTWNPITAMPVITPGGGIFATNWSMAFSPTAAVLCEYDNSFVGSPLRAVNGRKLFRSADGGATWITVKDVQDAELDDPNATAHFHTVGYHAATGIFIAARGDMGGIDGKSNRCFYKSTDDGVSWSKWLAKCGMQPIQIVDYQHPSRILCGSDMYGGAYWLDLNTEYATPLLYDRLTQTENGEGYVWSIKKTNGMIYAFQYDNSYTSPKWPKVWVSSDGENWGTYYQFSTPISLRGAQYMSGAAQGYLHFTLDTKQNFKLKEARTAVYPCALVLPKFQNVLNSDNKSHFTQDASAWTDGGSNYTVSRENTGLFGGYSLKIKTAEPNQSSYGYLRTQLNQASLKRNGRNYIGHVWVRGTVGDNCAYVNVMGSSGVASTSFFWTKNPDKWIDVLTLPDKMTSQGNWDQNGRVAVHVASAVSVCPPDSPFELVLGGAAIGANPTNFVTGDTPRNTKQLIYNRRIGKSWTSFLTFFPDAGFLHLKDYYDRWSSSITYDQGDYVCHFSETQPQGKIYKSLLDSNKTEPPYDWAEVAEPLELPRYHIKTWDFGSGDRLVLFLDCCPYFISKFIEKQGRKIKLSIYKAGSLMETLESVEPIVWERRSQFNIALSVGDNIRLYVRHPAASGPEEVIQNSSEVSSALATGFLKNRLVTHRYGDADYESLTLFTLFPPNMEFDSAMTNDSGDITRTMDGIVP